MKKIILGAVIILMTAWQSFAQFKLNGSIDYHDKNDTLILNVPFIYGAYAENELTIPIDSSGKFSLIVPVNELKFATLASRHSTITLLMSPEKELTLTLDTGGVFKSFRGSAAVENRLLYQAKLNEPPFFMHGDRRTNVYAKLSIPQVQEQIVKPWLHTRDENIKMVLAAGLPKQLKKLIASEIKYHAYVELDDFVRTALAMDFKGSSKLLLAVYEGATPNPDVYPAGPMYYYYANSYLGFLENKVFAEYDPKDPKSKEPFLRTYKMDMDSAMRMVKLKGKSYFKWYVLNLYFNRNVAEQYLAQNIYTQWHDKDLAHVTMLMNDFKINFPHSTYTRFLQDKMDGLARRYRQNITDETIKVFNGYQKVTSIYEVINTLKGKVIYLDIWGTWCPPCKDELRFNPQLKARFKNKDVAFVYLDMDDDKADASWQTFIRVNGLTGTQIRKSKADIQQFWNELLPAAGKRENYPTYFIFNKNGKLVQADAKRPSAGTALYIQLEKYL